MFCFANPTSIPLSHNSEKSLPSLRCTTSTASLSLGLRYSSVKSRRYMNGFSLSPPRSPLLIARDLTMESARDSDHAFPRCEGKGIHLALASPSRPAANEWTSLDDSRPSWNESAVRR
ncbi:hypothetical protein AVEN_106447-1 [Araneus ventricosus]|uniref:Uncharacterized protein n=1 Tax=Araneus ventricosus TaxID=182803 RepID=A0A4Y2ATW0_ARAVE|nr:hypothetical protein AVEN_106447-1 [Araneus ventricosus]